MSNHVDDERRLYQCVKKYDKMVKQVRYILFDVFYRIHTLVKIQVNRSS